MDPKAFTPPHKHTFKTTTILDILEFYIIKKQPSFHHKIPNSHVHKS